jgi:hypothetical protein
MHLAFQRGLTVLKKLDSDVGQCQELVVASSGPSRDTEGYSEVLKNVGLLEPVISKLMSKVAHKVF